MARKVSEINILSPFFRTFCFHPTICHGSSLNGQNVMQLVFARRSLLTLLKFSRSLSPFSIGCDELKEKDLTTTALSLLLLVVIFWRASRSWASCWKAVTIVDPETISYFDKKWELSISSHSKRMQLEVISCIFSLYFERSAVELPASLFESSADKRVITSFINGPISLSQKLISIALLNY